MFKKIFKRNAQINENQNSKLEQELKKLVENRRKELEKFKQISHEELYERMVKEAVLLISEIWMVKAESNDSTDDLLLCAYHVFCVTRDCLELSSERLIQPINPDTGRVCFFDTFKFESQDEVDRYVKDVLARLPSKTEVIEDDARTYVSRKEATSYTFKLPIEE